MGLSLFVGMLSVPEEDQAEGFPGFLLQLENINKLLAAAGLPKHVEAKPPQPWSAQMYGYTGLHYLRRIAAYVSAGKELPEPGDERSAEDPLVEAYYDQVTAKPEVPRGFDHLIVHSDCEGFYLPQDFPEVLFTIDDIKITGDMIGSAPRLLAECDRIAQTLGIPDHLHSQSEELWDASESQGEGAELWQRYGIESFSCVTLREGCRRSVESGAALIFT